MTRVAASSPAAFPTPSSRHRARRAAAFVSTGGLLVGLGAVSASPVFAATAADCFDDPDGFDNTLNSAEGDDRDDIQSLLLSDNAVICLVGTFDIDETLIPTGSLELYGLPGAVLNGVNTRIIEMVVDSPLVVENLTFQNGDASFGRGGAIAGYDVTIINSTFTDNAASDGGAVYGYGAVSVEGSTFLDNTADVYGGAIAAGTSEIENSTFVGNTAGDEGGAIFAGNSDVQFSTFLDNTSAAPEPEGELPGESIYLSVDFVDNLSIRGNIFAGSTGYPHLGVGGSPTSGEIFDFGGNVFSTPLATETDLGFAQPSTLFERTSAQLFGAGAAADSNGGPTQTVALIPGSPAIDAVPPLVEVTAASSSDALSPTAISNLTLDQRGEPRVANADAGAFELQADEIGGEGSEGPELAATGTTSGTAGLLGGAAALLMGLGAALALAGRRLARSSR